MIWHMPESVQMAKADKDMPTAEKDDWSGIFKMANLLLFIKSFLECQNHRSTSTSPSEGSQPVVLWWSSAPMLSPRLPRTSVSSALARPGLDSKAASSIASFLISCSKAETSPRETERVARASMARSSLMRTSSSSTPDLESCRWQTQDPTPMALSSSSAPWRRRG